jgi:radical SAM superfamily enzyme YgiQ (UPF0313 family)
MTAKILMVNPPIYDFAAYDFWLKPYGLISLAGYLRGKADFRLFDYLDRLHPYTAEQREFESDPWGRGRFYCERIPNPACLSDIPRYFRRFGLPRSMFEDFLREEGPFDFALVQTMMTYWYPGIQEAIEDLRRVWPAARIILGGNYVTLCESHAHRLGADLLVTGMNLEPMWKYLDLTPDLNQPVLWDAYEKLNVGVLKLTEGCPFNCTYCCVSKVYGTFKARSLERSLTGLGLLARMGAGNVAFYDDALLFQAEKVLIPFLEEVLKQDIRVNFHTPNALNSRFISRPLAELLVQAGFKTFYLGFESASPIWQNRTGAKVSADELAKAVQNLTAAGAQPSSITAYQLLGHPDTDIQQLEHSMRFAHSLGIRGMLADFSPIPGTPDGDRCSQWVDMNEPLLHNKSAFPIITLGFEQTNRLKDLQRKLNRSLNQPPLH